MRSATAATQELDVAAGLVEAILDHPYDSDMFAVYGDWLAEHDDPRGELIELQIAAERDPALRAAADQLLQAHAGTLLGRLAGHVASGDARLVWRFGFIHRARLAGPCAKIYDVLSRHPSGQFLVDLAMAPAMPPDVVRLVDSLVDHAPRTLHSLALETAADLDSWFNGVDLKQLWPVVPNLRRLVLDGGAYRYGAIDLPILEHAELRIGGLEAENLRALGYARLPALRHLALSGDDQWRRSLRFAAWMPQQFAGRSNGTHFDLEPFLARRDLPELRSLAITDCRFTDAACRLLHGTQVLARLERLDLSDGNLTDAGARMLVADRQFRHLAVLDVSRNYLSPATLAMLRGHFVNVVASS